MTANNTIRNLLTNMRVQNGSIQGQMPRSDGQPGLIWVDLDGVKDLLDSLPPREDGTSIVPPFRPDERVGLITRYLYLLFYVLGRDQLTGNAPLETPPAQENPDSLPTFTLTTRRIKDLNLVADKAVRVGHRTAHIIAPPGLYATESENEGPVQVFVQGSSINSENKDLSSVRSRFIFSVGNLPGQGSTVRFVRFYLHFDLIRGEVVQRLIKQRLDGAGLPFTFKFLQITDPNPVPQVIRKDTGVLFVSMDDFVPTLYALACRFGELGLTPGSTLFVKPFPYLPGLYFAEDPASVDSFGESRMRAIAQGIMGSAPLPDGRLDPKAVLNSLTRQGYRLNAFHLEPDPVFLYDKYLFTIKPALRPQWTHLESTLRLRQARQLGDWLCREALWLDLGHCNWLAPRTNCLPIEYQLLDESWQTGRLGISLFLRLLFNYTGYLLYEYVALGAVSELKKAIDNLENETLREALLALLNHPANPKVFSYEPVEEEPCKGFKIIDKVEDMQLFLRIRKALRVPKQDPFENEQVTDEPYLAEFFSVNLWGLLELVPGINGLALVGFGFLRAADRSLPPVPGD